MELRFMPGNADVQVGDLLTTSGVDGVYPPGLPVARVTAVERRAESGFARILLAPQRRQTACATCWCSNPWRCKCRRARPAVAGEAAKPARAAKGPRKRHSCTGSAADDHAARPSSC